MKFFLKNYRDYILNNQLILAKELQRKNPIINIEETKIRNNANYYEFKVKDNEIFDVDVVVENGNEVTVNRCSCGSISCSHLACCYEYLVKYLKPSDNIDNKYEMAKTEFNSSNPLSNLLSYCLNNMNEIQKNLFSFLENIILEKKVITFDYNNRRLFTEFVQELSRRKFSEEEVFKVVKLIGDNCISAYGNYHLDFANMVVKKFPIAYYALSYIWGQYVRIPKQNINDVAELYQKLNLEQPQIELSIRCKKYFEGKRYPYQSILDYVFDKKTFEPFDSNLVDNLESLLNCIYEFFPEKALIMMDYFEYYLPIDFHINDVLVNPQFFCKNYPDKTQSVLKELELNCHIDSIDMLKKIYEVINYFGTDFKNKFIEKTSLEFLKIFDEENSYISLEEGLPFSIKVDTYYNFFFGKEFILLMKPSLTRNGDDIIAIEKDNVASEHIIYLDENHRVTSVYCPICAHNSKPCIHQSSIINSLYNKRINQNLAYKYAEIIGKIEEKREVALILEKAKKAKKRLNGYFEEFQLVDENRLSEKVDIVPKVFLKEKVNYLEEYPITFSINYQDVTYKLDPTKFLNAIKNNEDYVYGKKLHFKHELQQFTERGRKIYGIIGHTYGHHDSIPFDGTQLSALLLELKNEGVVINGVNHLYVGEKTLSLMINDSHELTIEDIDEYKGRFLLTNSVDFYFEDNCYFELNYNFEKSRIICHDLLKNGPLSLEGLGDEFVNKLYPSLRKKIKISHDFAEENKLEQIVIKAYFDYNDFVISVEPKYYLNDNLIDEHEIMLDKKHIVEPFLHELQCLGFVDNKLINKDDIVNFIYSDLKGLREEATVYISDSLRKLYSSQKLNIKLNISKKSESMLDIYFEDLDYNEEELMMIYQAYKKQKNYVLLSDRLINLKNQEVSDFVDLVDDLKLDSKHLLSHFENPIYDVFKLDSSSIEFNFNEEIESLIIDIKNYQLNDFPLNEKILSVLRPYQLNGFKWMRLLLGKGLGCILADDMGIGKTLQTIAVIDSLELSKLAMVVCPKNIIYNWEAEVNRWAPWIKTLVIVGTKSERIALFENAFNEHYDLVIASYETIRIEEKYLDDKEFSLVVLDEAQNIKNPMVERTKAVKKLNAQYRLALTGTPIENSLSDVWSIFDFLMPGYLYKYKEFIDRIEKEKAYSLMNKKLSPFILRRTKNEVLKELPLKTEENIYISFDDKEKQRYQAEILNARRKLEEDPNNRMSILANLTLLREVCVDSRLIYEDIQYVSSKTETLLDMINNLIANNHKIIIFSQFVKYLNLLEDELKNAGYKYYIITGKTSAIDRQQMAEEFNQNPNVMVFLVSLKAGGVGLNLIGADTVIHVDPWWNYAVEVQASDRAYRIGQKKPVTIYKLIMKDSVEERVIKMQEAKRLLSVEVINENDEQMSKISINDIKDLLK